MKDGLTCDGPIIDDQSIAFESLLNCNPSCHQHEMAQQFGIAGLCSTKAWYRTLWNHQDMAGCHCVDVLECKTLIVLKDFICRKIAIDNLLKNCAQNCVLDLA